jgi:hypothetical protein
VIEKWNAHKLLKLPVNGQTDMLMLIGAFYDYPKASKGPAAQGDKKLLNTVTAGRFFKATYTLGLFEATLPKFQFNNILQCKKSSTNGLLIPKLTYHNLVCRYLPKRVIYSLPTSSCSTSTLIIVSGR